jgi:hypothetical protein
MSPTGDEHRGNFPNGSTAEKIIVMHLTLLIVLIIITISNNDVFHLVSCGAVIVSVWIVLNGNHRV